MPDATREVHSTPAALAAFLRGVERRGALLAQLQCGDAERGDVMLATAMRAFRAEAVELPMADWPRRFWQRLAGAAALAQASPAHGQWPGPVRHLVGLSPDVRLALLTRLAAGLPEDEAAEILACDLGHYRQALAAACPWDPSGQPDAQGWRVLAEAIQQQARDLSPERLARLARLRERALSQTDAPPATVAMPPSASAAGGAAAMPLPARPRWQRWGVGTVVAICVAGLLATYLWPRYAVTDGALPGRGQPGPGLGLAEEPAITVDALPAAEKPAARFEAEAAMLTHPDFELLRDAQDEAIAREADFHAWYLHESSRSAPAAEAATGETDAGTQEEGRDATF